MPAAKPYNGHRSWNAWNVSLWINNDECLYRRAVELAKRHGIARGALALHLDGSVSGLAWVHGLLVLPYTFTALAPAWRSLSSTGASAAW